MRKFLLLFLFCGSALGAGELPGLRAVQIHSDRIVTVVLGHEARERNLNDAALYWVSSEDDPDYEDRVHPVKLNRFSRASGFDGKKVLMNHWMFLSMDRPFKSGYHYTVHVGSGLLPSRFPKDQAFSLEDTPNPSFKLNQVGYSQKAKVKLVYLSSFLGDGVPVSIEEDEPFEVREVATGRAVLSGLIRKVSDHDPQGGDRLFVCDISSLDRPGRYYVWVEGLGRSYEFLQGHEAAKRIYDTMARGLFFQRSGIAIEGEVAGKWPRPLSHHQLWVQKKNVVHPWGRNRLNPLVASAGDYYVPEGPREFHGGHYDAGDYDQRPMHILIPELLMAAYETNPQKFYDGQTRLPENGDGLPDILDEVAWSLLAMEYFQDYATLRGLDGGVAPGVETTGHPSPLDNHGNGRDPHLYFLRKITPYSSFCAAAMFAAAARVFEAFDESRAAVYLRRAKDAYYFAIRHRHIVWDDGKLQGQSYTDGNLSDAWCWAAGQLYATTGDEAFLREFRARYQNVQGRVAGSVTLWGVWWGILVSKQDEARDLREELMDRLRRQAEKELAEVEASAGTGYRALLPSKGGWGNTSCVVRNIEAVTRLCLLEPSQRWIDGIATSLDFSLGMNPSEMSWVTGAGSWYPMNPCHLNSLNDDEEEPVPGILIFGPTDYWKREWVAMYPDKASMGFYRRVVDCWRHIAGCEFTVWETQVPFLFASTVLLPDPEEEVEGGVAEREPLLR